MLPQSEDDARLFELQVPLNEMASVEIEGKLDFGPRTGTTKFKFKTYKVR